MFRTFFAFITYLPLMFFCFCLLTYMYVFVCFLGIDLGVAYGIASLGRPVAIANHSNALVFVLLKFLCTSSSPSVATYLAYFSNIF